MSLFRNVSEINGDFSRKSPFFFHPVYLTSPLKGFPLVLGTDAMGQKTRMVGLQNGRKSYKIGLAVQTQYRRVTDIQTDRHATTAKTALTHGITPVTRNSADADNLRDAFRGQSRSTNMVPFWVRCDFR